MDLNGFLVIALALMVVAALYLITPLLILAPVLGTLGFIILSGFIILFPNEARVVTFFGNYMGTMNNSRFRFTIPFSTSILVPLKMINFNTEKLKVNDLNGNPVEVGAVAAWRVRDAAQSCFNVDNQSEDRFELLPREISL